MRTTSNRFMCAALLSMLALPGCQPGVDTLEPPHLATRGKVTLGVIRHGATAQKGVLRLTSERHILELSTFYMVVGDLELHACVDAPEKKAALDWIIPSAYAHVPESATRLGTPTLVDMLGKTGRARIIGEVAPPLGTYCSLRVVVAPADEDVVNLSELTPDALTGRSVLIEGRWRGAQDEESPGAWRSFSHQFTDASVWHVRLPEPIALERGEESAFVLVDSVLDDTLADALGAWMDTHDTEGPDGEAIAAQILRLVGDTQRRYTSPKAPAPP
jgi:hypothetical protein